MTNNSFYIPETSSTNNLLREKAHREELPEGFLLYTDFQTAGKGQPGNSWESEKGKNLLFSILLYPVNIKINEQFILSQLTCLAIKKVLDQYTDGITIKWSNDIYWKEKKICGILIENTLLRGKISKCVIGIGLNINQEDFISNAPNPVSLKQITDKELNREQILTDIHTELLKLYNELNFKNIQQTYHQNLYRKEGFHPYTDAETKEHFHAKIEQVEPNGKLILITDTGERRGYYFKEVAPSKSFPKGEI